MIVSGSSKSHCLIPASEHLLSIYNSIKMLHSRIKIIMEYTKAVQRGMTHLALHNTLFCTLILMPVKLEDKLCETRLEYYSR